MSNKTIGTIFLVASAAFCTFGVVGAKIAYAIERGMLHLATSGRVPNEPALGWEIAIAVVALAIIGLVFLFRGDDVYALREYTSRDGVNGTDP